MATAMQPLLRALAFAARQDFAHADRVGGLEGLLEACLSGASEAADADAAWIASVRAAGAGLDAAQGPARRRALQTLNTALAAGLELPEGLSNASEVQAEKVSEPREESPKGIPRGLCAGLRGLPGIGPSRAARLAERGVETVHDLLHFLPLGYRASVGCVPIASLSPGSRATVVGTVERAAPRFYARRGRGFEAVIDDGSGKLTVRYFRGGKWIEGKFVMGTRVAVAGEVRAPGARGGVRPGARLEMAHPEILDPACIAGRDEAPGSGPGPGGEGLQPRYAEVPGVPGRTVRLAIEAALPSLTILPDPLPAALRDRRELPSLADSLAALHVPPAEADPEALAEGRTPAHARLIYDEFFYLQLGLALKAQGVRRALGRALPIDEAAVSAVMALPPFELTGAQVRVLREIIADLREPEPMNRLLQGDVGSGKTVVAGLALLLTVRAGFQGALMAPTELLAEQHGRSLSSLLEPAGVKLVRLTGQMPAPARRAALIAIASGEAQVVVGTHALIQESVSFKNLAFVVVDEQHRFGVNQRMALMKKGERPDVMVMTATPIPRTLSMTAYGDLDLSILDELPPGRRPVHTRVFRSKQIDAVWAQVREAVRAGRQAYVVYPLVESSELLEDVQAATDRHQHLATEVFPDLEVGLIHGRMSAAQKAQVMEAFEAGRVQVLVATTVIEVGIDVSNATVMVVEHAERFGLSQLHQLRGRVGRGAKDSQCLLVAHPKQGEKIRERLQVMERSCDGFEIAEADLRIRGPGDLLGTRQSGHPDLVYGDIVRDRMILSRAREDAFALVAADPELSAPDHTLLGRELERRWHGRLALGRIG